MFDILELQCVVRWPLKNCFIYYSCTFEHLNIVSCHTQIPCCVGYFLCWQYNKTLHVYYMYSTCFISKQQRLATNSLLFNPQCCIKLLNCSQCIFMIVLQHFFNRIKKDPCVIVNHQGGLNTIDFINLLLWKPKKILPINKKHGN